METLPDTVLFVIIQQCLFFAEIKVASRVRYCGPPHEIERSIFHRGPLLRTLRQAE